VAGVEEIIAEITSQHKTLRREDIAALIRSKQDDAKGLLSEEGAARLVAEELLVQTEARAAAGMDIQNVVSGLNDVTVSVRILIGSSLQTFQRKDGTTGQVMRLLAADRTGQVTVVAWDKWAEEISKLENIQGQAARIEHAYTREGLNGRPELHLGERSNIVLNPPDIGAAELPQIEELLTKIAQVTDESTEVHLQAIVQSEPRLHAFKREEREGLVVRMTVVDETGSIPAVFWNERAAEVQGVKPGNIIRVIHARARKADSGIVEIHAESRSQVVIIGRSPIPADIGQAAPPLVVKLSELRGGMRDQVLQVQIVRRGDISEVRRLTGETVKVARVLVADETGLAALSLWDKAADHSLQLKEGDVVLIQGVSARERYGEISLSAGNATQIKILDKTEAPTSLPIWRNISELESARNLVAVRGTLIEEPTVREVQTGQGENVSVGTLRLADDTGDVRITLWRQHAQLASKLRKDMRIQLYGARVRPGLGGGVELSSTPATVMEIVQGQAERPAWQEVRQIIALKEGETAWVRGLVLETPEAFAYIACPKCMQRLSIISEEVTCEACGYNGPPQFRLTLRLKLDDGTGVLDVQADTHELEQILGDSAAWTVKEMKGKNATRLPLPTMITASLTGKKMEALGQAERSLTTGRPVFHSSKAILVE
jgi:replication factor A1